MLQRPTDTDRLMRFSWRAGLALAAALLTVVGAQPSSAQTESAPSGSEGSPLQVAASTTVDALLVRPLAATRALLGAALMVPTALLVSPTCIGNAVRGESCAPVYEAPYDVLVAEPATFAFQRELGDL